MVAKYVLMMVCLSGVGFNVVLVLLFQSGNTKSESVFELRTRKLELMPIIDFYPMDYGQSNQAFGFQMGPICFK